MRRVQRQASAWAGPKQMRWQSQRIKVSRNWLRNTWMRDVLSRTFCCVVARLLCCRGQWDVGPYSI